MMYILPGFASEIRKWNRVQVCKERGKPKENTTFFVVLVWLFFGFFFSPTQHYVLNNQMVSESKTARGLITQLHGDSFPTSTAAAPPTQQKYH